MRQLLRFSALLIALCLSLSAQSAQAQAQNASAWRGGWIADAGGARYILYLVLRDGRVSGTYCHGCANPANLALVDDGALRASGLRFALYHHPVDRAPYIEQAEAVLAGDELHLTIHGPDGAARQQILRRTPAEERVLLPMPDATPNAPVGGGTRELPGEAETITPASVAGLWLWGTGPGKQHFIFRQHKGGLRGMVCGPCDSAPDTAPLEGISISGDSFRFEIVHEDNGIALAEHGPHSNVATARISEHEMHLDVVPSYEGPDFAPIEMTLLGPIRE